MVFVDGGISRILIKRNLSIGFLFLLNIAIMHSYLQSPYFAADAQSSSIGQNNSTTQIYIPSTISKEAQQVLKNFKSDLVMANLPQSDDLEAWKKLSQQREGPRIASSMRIIDSYQANITHTKIGNASVIDIKPKNWIDDGKVLIYTHGGGYTQLSAN
jgi:epsilon-lactone hydrolase